jgi:hypothetical protein
MTIENNTNNKKSDPGIKECAIDFSTFVLSLATTAMSHLGELPDPATGRNETNLDEAKQIIDILCMLKEKTSGNLSHEESQMIEHFLYELRIKYLSKT